MRKFMERDTMLDLAGKGVRLILQLIRFSVDFAICAATISVVRFIPHFMALLNKFEAILNFSLNSSTVADMKKTIYMLLFVLAAVFVKTIIRMGSDTKKASLTAFKVYEDIKNKK